MKNMKTTFAILLLTLLSGVNTNTFTQVVECPESMVFDISHNRYYMSNSYNSTVCQVDNLGNISNFVDWGILNQPKGLEITGETLYVASSASVFAFSTDNAAMIMEINIPCAFCLTDVESDDNGNLFVSDECSNKIYKISLGSSQPSIIFENEDLEPCGLLFDHDTQNLLFCCSNDNLIRSVNPETYVVSVVATTYMSSPAGMARDNCGNIYISDREENSIFVFDAAFSNPAMRFAEGLAGPADICINNIDHILAVPTVLNDCFSFIQLQPGCELPSIVSPIDHSTINTEIVTLNWNNVTGADLYVVQITADSTFYDGMEYETSDTFYILSDLVPGTIYYWRVRTSGGPGKDIFSSVWIFDYLPNTFIQTVNADNNMKLFPNPAKETVYFNGNSEISNVSINDVTGRIVKEETFNNDTFINSLEINGLKNGVYLFTLIMRDGTRGSCKLIISQ